MPPARILGSFDIDDFQSAFVVAEWHPDPQVLAAEIMQMADAFDDWNIPLMECRQIMMESTQAHFDTETDPYGDKWEALDRDYRHWKVDKAGFPDHILVRTGALENYATSEAAWFIDERALYFNAFALPRASDDFPYGAAHQAGTSESTKRKRYEEIMAGGVKGGLSEEEIKFLEPGLRGTNLPQRMFVGADQADIASFEQIFVKHMIKTIEEPWGGGAVMEDWGEFGFGYGTSRLGEFPVYKMLPTGQPILRTPSGGYHFGRMGGGYSI
jgi:phage gpG-like protein